MTTNFIKMPNGTRIRQSKIQKYSPLNRTGISVYYTASRYKVDNEIFEFETEQKRNEFLLQMDELIK